MDFGDSGELDAFRDAVRGWLAVNVPEAPPAGEPREQYLRRWHQRLFEAGWMGLSWPVEYGGRGLTDTHEAILNEEIGNARAPDAPRIGYLGRAIMRWGTEEQKQRFIPRLLNGADFWCQGFSEPAAGSDIAAIATRADITGDTVVINGQKLWTSYAEYADWCLLLARSDPASERHQGISAFAVPMSVQGISIRPIRAITGDSEFCEMFFDDVEIPLGNRIGGDGDGWAIAMMTVAHERGAADVGYLSKFARSLEELCAATAARGAGPSETERLGLCIVDHLVLSYHVRRRLRERELTGGIPGPEMSIDKLLMTEADQCLHETAVDLLGVDALRDGWNDDDPDSWLHRYMYSRAASVYGGTEQIQLNILAQRLLGMPREAT